METAPLLDSASNQAVVHLPGRAFSGSVIQGDSLAHLYHLACEVEDGLSETASEEVRESAIELRELVEGRLQHYDEVLQRAGITRPYPTPKWRA